MVAETSHHIPTPQELAEARQEDEFDKLTTQGHVDPEEARRQLYGNDQQVVVASPTEQTITHTAVEPILPNNGNSTEPTLFDEGASVDDEEPTLSGEKARTQLRQQLAAQQLRSLLERNPGDIRYVAHVLQARQARKDRGLPATPERPGRPRI